MATNDDRKKRVFIAEIIKPHWAAWPTSQWPRQRFVVCHIDVSENKPILLSEILSEKAAYDWVELKRYDLISESIDDQLEIAEDENGQVDFTVMVTKSVMRELGIAIVEVVVYGKRGRLSNVKLLRSSFWMISISSNEVLSVHASLRHAYAAVSAKLEAQMKVKRPSP
jgi:hypothetical protein